MANAISVIRDCGHVVEVDIEGLAPAEAIDKVIAATEHRPCGACQADAPVDVTITYDERGE